MNWIRQHIEKNLSVFKLEVFDDSKKHQHHPGNTGGSHFELLLVSDDFEALSRIERHRLVYKALNMPHPEIHALAMKLYTRKEWEDTCQK
ncbi:MAG: BolA family transcriptional regulator [Bdellovibrionales bacterium]|nr:BolA family transcriptional regulator [Bdellovibrionales bacterium]